MDSVILDLISQGKAMAERNQAEQAAKEQAAIAAAQKSWEEFNAFLRGRLPEMFQPYMQPRINETNNPFLSVPCRISGYETVRVEIPELAPILCRINGDGSLLYQLPGIKDLGTELPYFRFGECGSDYYQMAEIPVLLYEAQKLHQEHAQRLAEFQQREAEREAQMAIKAEDGQDPPVERPATHWDEHLVRDLRELVREVVRSELD